MLSYRHGFHAGNFADLLKHLTLVYLLDYLNRKDKPYVYMDTHSGAGRYRLDSQEAQTTQEYRDGVGRLEGQVLCNPWLKRYWQLIQKERSKAPKSYPGSPLLAQQLLRPQDRLLLNELHPNDLAPLRKLFARQPRCQVEQQDAFALLKAALPPKERRGLVLIDPSYEKKTDYQQLIPALQGACKRFSTGIYALWYPVINRQETERWIKQLAAAGLPKMLRLEQAPYPDTSGPGMTASGLLVINPPYTLENDFVAVLAEVESLLRQGLPGKVRIEFIN